MTTNVMLAQIKIRMLDVILWPIRLVLTWGYNSCLLQSVDAIKICDLVSTDDAQRKLFSSSIVKSLELIEEYDAKRYRRVQKHIDYIVNKHTLMGGMYTPTMRSCDIDFSKFVCDGDDNRGIFALACIIIHEATHGTIHSYKIPYDKDHRLRVERLCHQEEVRFARRVTPDVELGEYDESNHETIYRMGKWQYLGRILRNLHPHNRHTCIL